MNIINITKQARGCIKVEVDTWGENAYVLTFLYAKIVVTIRIILHNPQSGADVTITNITRLPYSKTKSGYAKHAVAQVLTWMKTEGMKTCVASQVEEHNERFWTDRGFVKVGNETCDFKYTLP